nr:hypothetical protein BaRGS_006551 [Batillaria attramentaria]
METDSKSKSKEKHHDGHKKDKDKKVSPEKKTPEKTETPKEEKKAHSKPEEKKEEKKPAETQEKEKIKPKEKHDTKSESKHEKPKGADHHHETKKEKTSSKSSDKPANNPKEPKSHTKEDHKHSDSSSKTSSSSNSKPAKDKDSKPNKNKEPEKPAKVVNKNKNQDTDKKKEKEKKEDAEKKKKQQQQQEQKKEKEKEKQKEKEKEKQKEKEKANKKKEKEKEKEKEAEAAKRRKPVDDQDDFPYHLLDDEPVYTSMYDTIKRRSCKKVNQMEKVSDDTRMKLTQLKSRRGSTKKSKSSKSFLDDSSSDESDSNLLSLESDSQDSDSDTHSARGKAKKKPQPQPLSTKKKRPLVLSSSSDDEDEEDETALLRMSKSKPKSSQPKKFHQIFNSSSSEDDLDRDSSPERPPPKPKAAAKPQEKKSKPKKPVKKRKSTEESNNDSDIPDLQPAVKVDSKSSSHLASVSEISMAEDTMDESEKKDTAPQKKTKKKKKDEKPQKAKKTEEIPAKKPKLSDSRESLAETKEKKSEKKDKTAEKKVVKKEEKKMPVIDGEKMETSSEAEKCPEPKQEKVAEPVKDAVKKKKKKKDSKFNLEDMILDTSASSVADSLPKTAPEPQPKPKKEEEETTTVAKKKKKKKDKKADVEPSADEKQETKPVEPKQPPCSATPQEEVPKPKEAKKDDETVKAPKPEKEKKKKKNTEGKASESSSSLIESEASKTPAKKGGSSKKDSTPVTSETQASPTLASPTLTSTSDAKKEVKQEKAKEKKEKKSKAKAAQQAQEKSEKSEDTTPALSKDTPKDIHREPILQMLAEDMQREEKKLKDTADKCKNKQSEEAKDSSAAEDSKPKPKKKKKKKEEEKEPVSDLEPEPEEPEDPFVSFWGHPAPILHKKRDSIPRAEDGKEKDEKDKKKTGDSPASEDEGKPPSDDKKGTAGAASDSKPTEVKKPAWDLSVFAFDQETPVKPAAPAIDQEPKLLIDIPVDAFKPDVDETPEKSDVDGSAADKTKGQKKKPKKKKEKSDRKGSKETDDPLAAVEAAIKDDTVLDLQDVIDKKGVFPERRFSLEDKIGIPKNSSPLFMREGASALLKSPPHGKTDSRKQIDSKMAAESMPDPTYHESENDIGVFTPFTKEPRREKVVSTSSTEKPATVLQESNQDKAKQDQPDEGLSQLERDEIAMQEASDEAARAVECLLGFQEENNQFSFNNNDNDSVHVPPTVLPGAAGIVDTGTTLSSPPTVDSVALQSQPNTLGPEIHEASEAPQPSSQPEVQEQSLSVMQQQQEQEAEVKAEPAETNKKGQRRGKRQNRSKGSRDTPQKGDLNQQDMPGMEGKGVFPGQSPPYPVPGETQLPSMPDMSKLEGPELKRNPIDAYDFDAQMNQDDAGSDLIVESALSGMHGSSSDDQAPTMKSPRRRNSSRGGRGRRGRGGTIRETLEKMGKTEQPPASPLVDQTLPAPTPTPTSVPTVPQAPAIPVWQQEIVKADLASPDSKTDLDSSYGDAELVINLDDQNTPTDGEDRVNKGQYQFGSDTEEKSPAQLASAAAASPYKTSRSTRTRKTPNYKAMDQGLGMRSPSPRASRSGSSPRGARGGQSPKNTSTPRGRGSPKTSTEFGSPVVKLDRLEVGRGKKKDESAQRGRPGGKDSEGIEDVMHTTFEDWKAANLSVDQKPVSKENIYDFADNEQEQKLEPSPVLRGPRGRNKRPSDGGRGGARNAQKNTAVEPEPKTDAVAAGPSTANKPPADFTMPESVHDEPPVAAANPVHPKAGKAKQDMQGGMSFTGELPPDENPLRTMQPPAAHGEGRAHDLLMMQMLEQQHHQRLQHMIMAEAARSAAAHGAAARTAQEIARSTEASARSAAGQEASRAVAAAQEAARNTAAAAAKEAAARKEAVWSAHEAAERSLQEAGLSARANMEGAHKSGPLGRGQLPGMPPIPSSAASVQQVPLNLADSDSRSGSSDSRERSNGGNKPPPSPFNQPPGYMERERAGKSGDRAPPDSPHLAGGAFVPPPGGAPPGAHRDGLPPPLYGNELFHAPPFGMPVGRMPLDPRLYGGQQHPAPPHPPFLAGREGVLPSPFQQVVGQRFPLDQHPDAERLLKKGEMPPGGMLHMRSPSPIPSPSPRGLPPDMVAHPMMRVEIPVREHLSAVLGRYQMVWQGMLALKNDHSYVQMHFVSGSRDLPDQALPQPVIGGAALPLRISQRMRLETPNLEGVTKRMINEKDYSLLLAVPCGHDHMDISEQTRNLTVGFIEYLRSKLAAGIVNVSHPGTQQPAFVVHVFPPCDFSMEVVARHSSGLVEQIHDLAHVIIIITTV